MIKFNILTIFPKIFDSYFSESIIKRAQQKKRISIKIHDIRKFTTDKHKSVDDRPYGGGPGMVMKVEPIFKCLKSIKKTKGTKIFLLSAKGKTFNQKKATQLSRLKQVILICGHYEGVDERITKYIDGEISIGNYVLTGGEIPAMVVVDAVTRLIPGVLGDKMSTKDESFSVSENYLEHPHYTRPENFKGQKVPKVLLSGNHQKIANWRVKKAKSKKP